jgi:hypothetical protein
MSPARDPLPGATRTCPHCRATILESAAMCPGCRKYLRFDPNAAATARSQASFTPLRVEGDVPHPPPGEAWEYSVVIVIRNEKGEEVSRQVVGVGALLPHEARTFSLSVEVFAPGKPGIVAERTVQRPAVPASDQKARLPSSPIKR